MSFSPSEAPAVAATRSLAPSRAPAPARPGSGASSEAGLEAEACWAAVVARGAGADGEFWYAVATTGVYCRPSCGARLPRRENVSFYASREAAERAGFRACKRCQPDQLPLGERRAAQVAELCRYIENAGRMPSLNELSQRAGMSPHHLHRLFKSVTGLTPRAYAAAQRARRVHAELGRSPSVTAALYNAGYDSSGRFYADSRQRLGMTPSEYRAGGLNQEIRHALRSCSLGTLLVAATERGVCAILLGDEPEELRRDLARRFPRARFIGEDAQFQELVASVVALVERPETPPHLPLDVRGTAFQERVWQALRAIPAGATVSYAELARRLGQPRAVRAVAQACAANALAVAIPCHRVLRSDGTLSGYRWGVERKRALLEREKARGSAREALRTESSRAGRRC